MSEQKGVTSEILADFYDKVFQKNWPVWMGGLLIGLISIVTFAWSRPLGVVGGLREWFDWVFYYMGIYGSHPRLAPHLSSSSILTFGLIWGAMCSALLAREFAFKIPPPLEVARASVGGILMGIGAAMAMGCNVGGFFSATSALSLSGPAMMAGLLIGAFLETRYLYYEIQVLRFRRGDGKPRKPEPGSFDWKAIQPRAGAFAVLAAFVAAYIYGCCGVSGAGFNYAKPGGLLLCGLAFGFVLHRSRFAFQQGLREPFSSGNAAQARGLAIAVIVSVLGFAAIKASGLRPAGIYVTPTFWVGSFVGGIIFGFGMPFAGGCASGICWRSADGSVKQIIALAFMGLSNSVSKVAIDSSRTLSSMMGGQVYLPKYISYQWTLVLIISLMLLYMLVTTWNEKTGKFL